MNRARTIGLLALLTLAILFMFAALLGLVFPYSLALAIPAVACAMWVWNRTNHANRAMRWSALAVGVASGILLFAGGLWSFVRYRAEAPAGYLRVNFDETFQDGGFGEIASKFPAGRIPVRVPAGIQPLIDQCICVKGYGFPSSRSIGMSGFVMLQESKPFRVGSIQVILKKGQLWNWTRDPVAVSGRLVLNEYWRFLTDDGHIVCKYLLIDAVVRPATTPFGLAERPRSSC